MTPGPVDRRDRGASLLLALVFVIAISLVVGALLTYSAAGLATQRNALVNGAALIPADQAPYDVEGSLQRAINDVRNGDYFNNTYLGQTCFSGGSTKTYTPISGNGGSVTVACATDPNSGAAGGLVPVSDSNKPSLALLTLGTGGEDGIYKDGNTPLNIKGSVYSNSTVVSNGASQCAATWPPPSPGSNCNGIFVSGATLTAEGACSGTVMAPTVPAKRCGTGSHVSAGDDPANTYPTSYAQPTTGLTPQALPTCGAGTLVTFSPGYYDDAVGLSDLMKGSVSCRGKTFWFQPGIYYFDFHNSDMPASGTPVVPNGPNVWTFNDSSSLLVGGTKQGWTTMASPSMVPGACVSPLTSSATTGVQFVFGGDSQFVMKQGNFEICGTWYSNKPPIVLYGAKTTVGTNGSGALIPSAMVDNGGDKAFTPVTAAAATNLGSSADGNAGTSATGIGKNKSASLKVTQFSGLSPALGARTTLDSLKVNIRHGEKGANAGTTLTLKLTPNRAGASPVTKTLTVSTGSTLAYTTETVDFTADLQSEVYAYGLGSAATPFTIEVTAQADSANGQSIDEQIDLLTVNAQWRTNVFRAQSGCVAAVAGCPVIGTNNQDKKIYFQGTAYAPKAAIDLRMNNIAGQVFRSGVVARAFSMTITASSGYAGPVIELPDNTLAPTPLRVFFTAWTCPSGSCSLPQSTGTGWKAMGRAAVTYTDASFTPTPGSRQVTITGWNITR